ncbi:A/G-specific DNA-adenine glycosylase [Tistlia consotensis]|uniref:Adenine DNA glycosylase n=1 Tax=Tistlia consotensis USBA 355 TaxID=560819 RepID=A0A1Y6CNM2_9PROT|nr:A/G-specific adenine glycosylase [Tistlia consotensis]SMF62463.1 A/G-specific DNA-adenine glycosylase [Tistlia consotensis USBA 355]SNR94782.1 A/G-specific DNA-adenine glycosylase [Tistlia consotensis]
MDSRPPPPQPDSPTAETVAGRLLAWYDRHRRRLPWRAGPGETPDPYRVWLSEIMLQQTTVATVGPYFERFTARWPTVAALAAAPLDAVLAEWAGLGYYARARNLHACARAVVERHGGAFPDEEAALLALPGVGAYTAAAVAAIAFDRPASPLDGNIERVVARLFAVAEPLPGAKPELRRLAATLTPSARPGDYAQAAMDLGATVCLPAKPKCLLCPLEADCRARALGIAERLPAKAPKAERPTRRGVAFLARRADGRVLLRRRPDKGLLGGMAELPSTDWRTESWAEAEALGSAPLPAAWDALPGLVRHTFTHFHLELGVWRAELPAATDSPAGARWVPIDGLAGEALPTVMRKLLRHGLA